MKTSRLLALSSICLLLAACAPSVESIQTAVAQTKSAWTPIPTQTAYLTYTAIPTNTPRPTNTPLIFTPTPIPTSKTYEGSGDSVIELPVAAYGFLHIVGNSSSNYFGVEAFDAQNNSVDLLVNTTDPYDGRLMLNLVGEEIARLQISASNTWIVEYIPFAAYDHINQGKGIIPLIGKGDDVWVFQSTIRPKIITIKGNSASRYFGVEVYGLKDSDLAVNTTDPYSGIYLYPASLGDLLFIVITAEGDWNVIIQE